MRLKLRPDKICAIRIHTINGYVPIIVRRDHVTVRLELDAGHVGPGRCFDYVCAFKEAVLATVPEGQMSPAVRYDEVVVQRMEGSSGQSLLEGLKVIQEIISYPFVTFSIDPLTATFPSKCPHCHCQTDRILSRPASTANT